MCVCVLACLDVFVSHNYVSNLFKCDCNFVLVVMLDQVVAEENRNILKIFERINDVTDPSFTDVLFDTVIVTNVSTALQQGMPTL